MKKTTKVLALLLCAVLLVAGSVMGTLAFLTSKDTATNTFTVGQVHIKLDEADVNENGEKLNSEGEVYKEGDTLADRVDSNEYKLIPGSTYTKDPTVWVREDSEPSFIRMQVTFTNYSQLKEVFGDGFLPQNFVNGTWDSTKWIPDTNVAVDTVKNTATYTFYYFKIYDAEPDTDETDGGFVDLEPLFTEIKFPGEWLDNNDVAKLEGLTITVEAHAIQAKGFEDSKDDAWTAFAGQQAENAKKTTG